MKALGKKKIGKTADKNPEVFGGLETNPNDNEATRKFIVAGRNALLSNQDAIEAANNVYSEKLHQDTDHPTDQARKLDELILIMEANNSTGQDK